MSGTVRRGCIEDLVGLSDLFDQYRQFYGQPSDLTLARTFLEQRMQRPPSRSSIPRSARCRQHRC
jgi:hypothetical protein